MGCPAKLQRDPEIFYRSLENTLSFFSIPLNCSGILKFSNNLTSLYSLSYENFGQGVAGSPEGIPLEKSRLPAETL
jgi:hypothetical protein